MKIFINGQSINFASEQVTVAEALQQFLSPEQQQQSYAVAVNADFVGKQQYAHTALAQGDSIDVLFPIQGG